jgi:hypothetical protein
VQQYWVNNATTGAFTLGVKTASGTATLVDQGSTAILYCDGTDIISATTSAAFAGVLPVTQGGTGATTASGARTNLGATGIGAALFTAATDASARSTISAAASGANTDITALDQDVTITATGTIAADTLGFRGLPQNSQTASYTLALSDAGKHISITTGGVIIPANSSIAFPVGTTIVIFNDSGSNQTISITTDTLRLAGTASTGSRTLGQYGLATCVKVASTTWVISGSVT